MDRVSQDRSGFKARFDESPAASYNDLW